MMNTSTTATADRSTQPYQPEQLAKPDPEREQATPPSSSVACLGETFWKVSTSGLFLSGFAYQIPHFLKKTQTDSLPISSVGSDDLGRVALKVMANEGLDISCIQVSNTIPTGLLEPENQNQQFASTNLLIQSTLTDLPATKLLASKLEECTALIFNHIATSNQLLDSIIAQFHGLKICDLSLCKPNNENFNRLLAIARHSRVLILSQKSLSDFATLVSEHANPSLEQTLKILKEKTGASLMFTIMENGPSVYFDGEQSLYAAPRYIDSQEDEGDPIIDKQLAYCAFSAETARGLLDKIPMNECLARSVQAATAFASKTPVNIAVSENRKQEDHGGPEIAI